MAFSGDILILDDHGILHDAMTDLMIDDVGILHDDNDIFTNDTHFGSYGADSGIGGDKQSSTSILLYTHTSFDDELAPVCDETLNISDFEASRDDFSANEDVNNAQSSRTRFVQNSENATCFLETPGSMLEHTIEYFVENGIGNFKMVSEKVDFFTEEYYKQLKELGVLVDGVDFSRDESLDDTDILEASEENLDYFNEADWKSLQIGKEEYGTEKVKKMTNKSDTDLDAGTNSSTTGNSHPFPEIPPDDRDSLRDSDEVFLANHKLLSFSSDPLDSKIPLNIHTSENGHHKNDHHKISHTNELKEEDKKQLNATEKIQLNQVGKCAAYDEKTIQEYYLEQCTFTASDADNLSSISKDLSHLTQSDETVEAAKPVSGAESLENSLEENRQIDSVGENSNRCLLPIPNSGLTGHTFQVRMSSKNVSNISDSSVMLKPMFFNGKIHRREDEQEKTVRSTKNDFDDSLAILEGELNSQLKQESFRRKQATDLVKQLQKEYHTLLSKYAVAELTIDQMRLGARISLNEDSPASNNVQLPLQSVDNDDHKDQVTKFELLTVQSALMQDEISTADEIQLNGDQTTSEADPSVLRGQHTVSSSNRGSMTDLFSAVNTRMESADGQTVTSGKPAEAVQLSLSFQTRLVNDRLEQFQNNLEQQLLSLEEQEHMINSLHSDHEKLRRVFLQAKEDYNTLKRSGSLLPFEFDSSKELEGQLFHLGMKFDEIFEQVESNLKKKTMQRQPFHGSDHIITEKDKVLNENDDTNNIMQIDIERHSIPHNTDQENNDDNVLTKLSRPSRFKQMIQHPTANVTGFNGSVIEFPDKPFERPLLLYSQQLNGSILPQSQLGSSSSVSSMASSDLHDLRSTHELHRDVSLNLADFTLDGHHERHSYDDLNKFTSSDAYNTDYVPQMIISKLTSNKQIKDDQNEVKKLSKLQEETLVDSKVKRILEPDQEYLSTPDATIETPNDETHDSDISDIPLAEAQKEDESTFKYQPCHRHPGSHHLSGESKTVEESSLDEVSTGKEKSQMKSWLLTDDSKQLHNLQQYRGRRHSRTQNGDVLNSKQISARLHALQIEIERLKQGLKQTEASQHHVLPASQQEESKYIDPFDRPQSFMNHHRANSFSNIFESDPGKWYWTLHNKHQSNEEDISTGYATADAYSNKFCDQNRSEITHSWPHGEHHDVKHKKQVDEIYAKTAICKPKNKMVMSGIEHNKTKMSSTRPQATEPVRVWSFKTPDRIDQATYNYCLPKHILLTREKAAGLATSSKISNHSSPYSKSKTQNSFRPPQYACHYQNTGRVPWYDIHHSQWPLADVQYPSTARYHNRTAYLGQEPKLQQPTSKYYSNILQPLCGSIGSRIHEEDVDLVHAYQSYNFAAQRNRSMIGSGACSKGQSILRGHRSQHYRQRCISDNQPDFDESGDLNESLYLSEDINRLTQRMISTVCSELQRSYDSNRLDQEDLNAGEE